MSNAKYVAAYRQRQAAKLKRYEALAVACRDELSNGNTEKGRKLYAMAVEALG